MYQVIFTGTVPEEQYHEWIEDPDGEDAEEQMIAYLKQEHPFDVMSGFINLLDNYTLDVIADPVDDFFAED